IQQRVRQRVTESRRYRKGHERYISLAHADYMLKQVDEPYLSMWSPACRGPCPTTNNVVEKSFDLSKHHFHNAPAGQRMTTFIDTEVSKIAPARQSHVMAFIMGHDFSTRVRNERTASVKKAKAMDPAQVTKVTQDQYSVVSCEDPGVIYTVTREMRFGKCTCPHFLKLRKEFTTHYVPCKHVCKVSSMFFGQATPRIGIDTVARARVLQRYEPPAVFKRDTYYYDLQMALLNCPEEQKWEIMCNVMADLRTPFPVSKPQAKVMVRKRIGKFIPKANTPAGRREKARRQQAAIARQAEQEDED
ncbi:hypothetical protein KIPB_012795, partial [Kipferlia bialata]